MIERIHRLKKLTVNLRAGKGAVRHYRAVKSDGPEDLVFQLLSKNAPQCANNVLFRHIKPAARALGIPWVNWQVLRGSHATCLKMAGADVKDAQAQMRRSRDPSHQMREQAIVRRKPGPGVVHQWMLFSWLDLNSFPLSQCVPLTHEERPIAAIGHAEHTETKANWQVISRCFRTALGLTPKIWR